MNHLSITNIGVLASKSINAPTFPGSPYYAYAPDYSPSVLNASGNPASFWEKVATVQDISGNGRHLTQANDLNRPRYLKLPESFAYRTDVSQYDWIKINHSSSYNVDDFTAEVSITPVWTTPPSDRSLISKTDASGLNYCFQMYCNSSGNLILVVYSPSGLGFASTSQFVFTVGQKVWIRVQYVRNTGAGQVAVTFHTSSDGVTYTQLGSTLTAASPSALNNAGEQINIGSAHQGLIPFVGCYHHAKLWGGSPSGTLLMHWDANDSIESSLSGALRTGPTQAQYENIPLVTRGVLNGVGETWLDLATAYGVPIPFAAGFKHFGISNGNTAGTGSYVAGSMFYQAASTSPSYICAHFWTYGYYVGNDSFYIGGGDGQVKNPKRIYAHMIGSQGYIASQGGGVSGVINSNPGNPVNCAYRASLCHTVMGRNALWQGTLPTQASIEAWLDP